MAKSKLDEFVKFAEDEKVNRDRDRVGYRLNQLPVSERVQIAQEYNEIKNPSIEQTLVASTIEINRYYEKIENKDEAEQIMQAYAKCAQNLEKANDTKLKGNKYDLGRNIKSFVCGNPEYSAKGFDILDKYLTDVDVIDPIRSCMSRDDSLIDKGFAAIHKSADSICARDSDDKAAARQLNLAFADLYNLHGHRDSAEMIDKITSHFSEFEKQMDTRYCNLEYICEAPKSHNEEVRKKMNGLSKIFGEWKKGKESFNVIHERETSRHSFIDMVEQKVKARSKAKGEDYLSNDDRRLLHRVAAKADYLTIKEEGKSGDKDVIDRNKILMQAHRESKNQGK